jgi:C4-dicarboxylate transporter, DctM subunit
VIGPILAGFFGFGLLSRASLGAVLAAAGFAMLYWVADADLSFGVQAAWNLLNNYTLIAMPLFLILGEVLLASNVGNRVYSALMPLLSRLPGGLLHTNVVSSAVFGAVIGTSMSTAAVVGSVAYPELEKRGYDRSHVVGSLAGAGTLGMLLPPSIVLIIFGALTETSVGRLYMAGVLPGLLIVLIMMVFISGAALARPAIAPKADPVPLAQSIRQLLSIWPIVVLIVCIMGSITSGLATPTESAAVGVLAAILIGWLWGDLTPGKLVRAFASSCQTFAAIGFILIGSAILSQAFSILAVPPQLLETLADAQLGSMATIFLVILFFFVAGMFFDGMSLMIVSLPVVVPILASMGYDRVWQGVFITILIELSMITPPVGVNLFVLMSIARGEVTLSEATRAVLPYWLILIASLFILLAVPALALYLPDLVYGVD